MISKLNVEVEKQHKKLKKTKNKCPDSAKNQSGLAACAEQVKAIDWYMLDPNQSCLSDRFCLLS
jgi:hypothetical protein